MNACFFYVIALVPDLEPRRLKFGVSNSPSTRLKSHQTAAPTAELVAVWPIDRVGEARCIERATASGCQQIGPEIFDVDSLDEVIYRIRSVLGDASESPLENGVTRRTISVLEGDWDRWTRTAGERGIAERGRAYSVSEYIRRAVEVYDGNGKGEGAPACPAGVCEETRGRRRNVVEHSPARRNPEPDRSSGPARGLGMGGRVAQPRNEDLAVTSDGGAVKREAKAPDATLAAAMERQATTFPVRAPVPKATSARRRKP